MIIVLDCLYFIIYSQEGLDVYLYMAIYAALRLSELLFCEER